MSESILLNRALFEFDLSAVIVGNAEIGDSQELSFAKPFDVEILELDNRILAQEEKFKTRVQDLSFRPKIVEGLPEKSEILLEYQIFSRLKE